MSLFREMSFTSLLFLFMLVIISLGVAYLLP